MVKLRSNKIDIAGVSCAVPGNPLSIFEMDSSFNEKEIKKFAKMTGVNELYRTNDNQTTIDLCIAAAKNLLLKLDWRPEEVNGLIFVSQTPDYFLPVSSAIAQRELGLSTDCFCFDINQGCSGYIYGLQVAASMLQKENCEKVLLLSGDTISKLISPEDKSVSLLFGDAGSATAIQYKENATSSTFILGTDGNGAKNLIVPHGAFRNKGITEESLIRRTDDSGNKRTLRDLYMNGSEIFNFTIREIPTLIEETLHFHGYSKDEIDYYVLHQANKFILEQITRKIEVDKAKVPISIDKYGNTSSATIPLALINSPISEKNQIRNKHLLLAGFGVGYSWGAAVIHFENTLVTDLIHI